MGLFDSYGSLIAGGLLGTAGLYFGGPGVALMGAGLGSSLYGQVQNYQQQEQNYDWQRKQQYTTWAREDTSIQRRVADLKAAGLSPVLAAGQGAGAGSIVQTKPPQQDTDKLASVMQVMSLLKMKSDIDTSLTQRELIKHQTNLADTQAMNQLSSAELSHQIARLRRIEADIASKSGTTGQSPFGKIFNDLFGGGNMAVKTAEEELKEKIGPRAQPPKEKPKQKLKTKPDWMNQSDWEFYLQNTK